MLRKMLLWILAAVLLTWAGDLMAGPDSADTTPLTFNLGDEVPLDQEVTAGKLDNGLTYYIRVNKKPENRAELRLAVNAGSILEEDDQQGLAHFVEHMAFNGSEHFKKQELIDYLESIGMQFGPELNAYTGFDQTVYMLQVPTDSLEQLKTAFQILEDWAHLLILDTAEIDKERGVIVEEWRLGRGADARMQDKQIPILLKGSKYAERLPIGKMEIIENFQYGILRKFYTDWYRPDLMAVVAVGDFDPAMIEEMIKAHFGSIPAPENPRLRQEFPIPDHKETLFTIVSDPEATLSTVSLFYKLPKKEVRTVADYREDVVAQVYNLMLMERLSELSRQADPPLLMAFSIKGSFISKNKDMYIMLGMVKEGGIERGFEALLREARRIKLHGFTESELERQKKQLLRNIERTFNERDKMESNRFASNYIDHYLNGSRHPGTEYDYAFCQTYLPGITLEEVNALVDEWMREESRVISVSSPEKPDLKIPTEQELLAIFQKIETEEISAYEDKMPDQPLLKTLPSPSRVVSEEYLEAIDTYHWELANGVEVVLKATDFKNDDIQFRAFSPGGISLLSDDQLVAAQTAAAIILESGIGDFDKTQLQKYLADKVVQVSPDISDEWETFWGNASPKDLETMFQLIYLCFAQPRLDNSAYLAYKTKMEAFLKNRSVDPQSVFSDTILLSLTQHNPRTFIWDSACLERMNPDQSFDIYLDRFADAGDFTFILVGNINIDSIRPMIETYLGGMPSRKRIESWQDRGIDFPEHSIKKEVYKGLEPKSNVQIYYYGDYLWDRQNNYNFNTLAQYLDIKLREVVREDKSGTYGVSVDHNYSHYPDQEYSLSISFGCDPERVEELSQTVFAQLDSLLNFGVDQSYVQKVSEIQRREYEKRLKENGFWVNSLYAAFMNGTDPLLILEYERLIDNLSAEAIQETAQKYLNPERRAIFTLYPETESDMPK